MAYDKYTWVDGEVITAQKLNHIEEGIENGDNGYECKTNEYIDATITTEDKGYNCGEITIQGVFINAPTITVVYDGTEYTAKGTDASGGTGQAFFYGDDMRDFSTLPFYIYSGSGSTQICTQTVGEHTIKITGDTIETTDCFKAAIAKAAPSNIIVSKTRYFSNNMGEMYDSEYPKDFISTPDDTFLLLLEEQSEHTRYAAILGWSTSQSDIGGAWRAYNYVSLGDNALSLSDILKMFPANHADALQNKDFHPTKMRFYVPTASKTYSIMLIKLTN